SEGRRDACGTLQPDGTGGGDRGVDAVGHRRSRCRDARMGTPRARAPEWSFRQVAPPATRAGGRRVARSARLRRRSVPHGRTRARGEGEVREGSLLVGRASAQAALGALWVTLRMDAVCAPVALPKAASDRAAVADDLP